MESDKRSVTHRRTRPTHALHNSLPFVTLSNICLSSIFPNQCPAKHLPNALIRFVTYGILARKHISNISLKKMHRKNKQQWAKNISA